MGCYPRLTCDCLSLSLGLGLVKGERLGDWRLDLHPLGPRHRHASSGLTGSCWVSEGSGVLLRVHVQQGVAGHPARPAHQLHHVWLDLAVGGGGGGVQLLDVGTRRGLGGNRLPDKTSKIKSELEQIWTTTKWLAERFKN